jgi:hypothetical protein
MSKLEKPQAAPLSGQNPRSGEVGKNMKEEIAEAALLANLKGRLSHMRDLLRECEDHWGYEDPIYRFYHQSFKVYDLQKRTEQIVALLHELLPGSVLDAWFLEIVSQGTGKTFSPDHNRDWPRHTRAIVEAFFHARFFLEMAVRYAGLPAPPNPLPSGWAALLSLYGLR